ncbi:glycoside hydrolase family 28 protein [Fulvivirgaceae bacterium BMA12]|uniref:Glycoside hydrolase family 28 protein n=1 Tax=Agaribacillus aureus TaxID=3051825 RepID=A0ABT8LJN5_9BACT|nr:glycoside hydrolase family 28 protein [Fulvivirgaceae bacterium BMA12]
MIVKRKNKVRSFLLVITFGIITTGMSFSQNANSIYNVLDFGAKGDGKQLDTKAIQRAVDLCAKKGGKILLPAGTYLTGTIYLKSNITLHIAEGATLLGSTDIGQYPENIPDYRFYGDTWVRQSLIYGENLENIAIEGRGTIDGQGEAFVVTTKKKPDRYRNRPYCLWFIKCKNVRVEDISMQNSAMWMQHYLACDKVTIRGISVYNHANKNNDMIDIDGCRDVIISGCFGDTDDDAITIKSTSPRPSENVIIENCVISSHVNAIKMGTESTGGFKNIVISNIVVRPSRSKSKIYGTHRGMGGVALEIVDGGIMDGIVLSNLRIDGPQVPIFIRLGNRARKYVDTTQTPGVGVLRNVNISNIIATGADTTGCSITGIPGHPVENISLSNIQITYTGGGKSSGAFKEVPEYEDEYPEGGMFGSLPAYGFFIRHAIDISLKNISLKFEGTEERPSLICDDVADLDLSGFRAASGSDSQSFIVLKDTRNALIRGAHPFTEVNTFLSIMGSKTKQIGLTGNDFRKTRQIVAVGKETEMGVVNITGNLIND